MSRELRDALSYWATGVVIITGKDKSGEPYGMTVNSFASVSLDPALVLWSVQQSCEYKDVFDDGYCVSVLGLHQNNYVWKFTKGTQAERFNDVPTVSLDSGRLAIADAIAHFDCKLHQKVSAGDHDILIGEVLEFASVDKPPVLFNRGVLSQMG